MADDDKADDGEIKRIGEDDQLAASIKSTAEMTLEMFGILLDDGTMTRIEAFTMTQTWLTGVLRGAADQRSKD